jgi:hypothetical protein
MKKISYLVGVMFVIFIITGCTNEQEIDENNQNVVNDVAQPLNIEGALNLNQRINQSENANKPEVEEIKKEIIQKIEQEGKIAGPERTNVKRNDTKQECDNNEVYDVKTKTCLQDKNEDNKQDDVNNESSGEHVDTDVKKCIDDGGVYNTQLQKCFIDGPDYKGENIDDKIDPEVKDCIDKGGIYNSQLQQCFVD